MCRPWDGNKLEKLERVSDPKNDQEIERLFDAIIDRLRSMAEEEKITAYEASTLYDALKVVVEALGEKHKAKKEVKTIMGGGILEFSADKYFNAGKKEGQEEGMEKGEEKGVVKGEKNLAARITEMISSGKTMEEINSFCTSVVMAEEGEAFQG